MLQICSLIDWLSFLENCLKFVIFIPLEIVYNFSSHLEYD